MKNIFIVCILFVILNPCIAQKKMSLTLKDVLLISKAQSLQSFLIKNYYLADYWQYKSYKANYLPSVVLNSSLFSYNNSSRLRYNSFSKLDEFVRTENLGSDAEININQKIRLTGGNLSLTSNLGRNESFGGEGYEQYSSIPIRLGYSQKIFGFNSLKWEHKLEPIKFEKAKKNYIQSVESMNIKAISIFFQLAKAKQKLKTAEYNSSQTDTLLKIAQKRFQLGSITKDELLDLKLNKNNNKIALQEAEINLRKALENILSFLMIPKDVNLNIVLPQEIPQLHIEGEKALEIALQNNPEIITNKLSILQSEKEVEKTKAENRFNANLGINVGMSKNDGFYDSRNKKAVNGKLDNVYKGEFDGNQVVNVRVSIPILDWGRGKGYSKMAKSRQQVAEIAAQQAMQRFEQDALTQVMEFNIQESKVDAAALSDTLASESYDLTITRFRRGTIDVLKLVNTQNAKDNAQLNYISALAEYWKSYYAIRQLTLYDFANDKPLNVDFEKLIE